MSTRATYQFRSSREANFGHSHPTVTFYIHYDGYPDGAACYLADAVLYTAKDCHGGLVANFLRANPLAEFTDSHEIHGDTEWRYTVTRVKDAETLLVQERESGNWDNPTWREYFNGPLANFLNIHAKEQAPSITPRLATADPWITYAGITVPSARLFDQRTTTERRAWEQLGRGHTGNACSTVSELSRLCGALGMALPRELAEACAKRNNPDNPEHQERVTAHLLAIA